MKRSGIERWKRFGRSLGHRLGLSILLWSVAACRSIERPEHFRIEPSARWWRTPLTGEVEITAGGAPGSATEIDVEEDLGLERENHLTFSADVHLADHRLTLSYLPLSFDGDAVLSEDIKFRDQLFLKGESVKSQVSLDTLIARYDYPLYGDDRAGARLGASIYWWELEAEIESLTTFTQAERDFSRLLPGAHIEGHQPFGPAILEILGAAALLDEGRRLFELDGQISVPLEELGIPLKGAVGGGYRYLFYGLNEDTNVGDLTVQGPFAELSFWF